MKMSICIDVFFVCVHLTSLPSVIQENGSGCLDTVGAVVVDLEGNVAAAVSSGGLAMKHPGRVGQVFSPATPFFGHAFVYIITSLKNKFLCN